MAEGVTVANAFVQVMPSMEGATSNLTNALVPSLGDAGDQAGSKFGNMFTGKAGALLKTGAAALGGIFAAGALKDAYEGVEAGFNKVKIATGATGEQAEALKNVYLDVSKSVSGSFEDIGSAVGELNTRFGLNGEELEKASEAAMKYAKVTGQDATKAVQDVSRMMNNAGIPASEYANVLDKLTVAGQQAGVDVGKLATSVTDNAASFTQLGFSTDEAIAMLANFEKTGANTSAILAGMKKGVAEWSKAGIDAKTGFNEFVKGVQDGTIKADDAIELFGAKAGVTMYDAAQKGQLNFEEMYAAITDGSTGALDSVYQDTLTASEKFDILGKNLQAGFFEIIEPIVDALMPLVDTAITALTELINGAVETMKPFIEEFSAQIGPIMEETLPQLQEVFTTVMMTISDIVQQAWPYISEIVTTAMTVISEIMETVWPTIRDLITNVMNVVGPLLEQAWPVIRDIAVNNMKAIEAIVQNVWPVIQQIIEGATQAIDTAIRALEPLASFISDLFNNIKSFIEDPIGTARDFIEDAMSTIESIINGLDLSLPDISLPHFNVWGGEFPYGIGGMGYPPEFSVDWYAKGGFADEPTLNGYGERGLEMYWPGYAPYFDMYAKGIAEHMPASGVDIHDCTFNIRKESDIRAVAVELNTLINRQTAGGIA